MTYDCDVIVVGSGAGGATFATACARAGKSVLLLERGKPYLLPEAVHNEEAMLIDKKPYDDRSIDVNGIAKRLYMGGVVGGSTALYGAALMRPSRDDFHPGKFYGDRIPRAIWDWPVGYDTLEPYYTEAEKLYGVSGNCDDDFGPLQKPQNGYPLRPLPLHPINQKLMSANQASGLRPFRLPLAIDPERCLRCGACAGYICLNGARRSARQLVEQTVADGHRLRLLAGAEVEWVAINGTGPANGVSVLDRSTGERATYSARRYVLAAGAIGTPLLLLKSGVDDPLLGRNYMMHLSPLVVGILPRASGTDTTFVKQVGFADYYFGTKEFGHKMGLVQSLPVPGPLLTAKTSPRFLPRSVQEVFRRRMLPLAGIVEDLPDPANRISWGPSGQPQLHHRFSPYDLERGRHLRRPMAQILKKAGALLCVSRQSPSDEHVAHQCGTARFGSDPAHAVLDADCRMFRHPNVFVVDGSVFPTSLGVGPALTIAANALRVANVVASEV